MGKRLREWLIRRLGGYTQGELAFRDARIELLQREVVTPQMIRAAYIFYDDISGNPPRYEARENAREALAAKIGQQLMDGGWIHVHLAVEPGQEGKPIKRMRLTGTAWVLPPAKMMPKARNWPEGGNHGNS